MMSGLSERQLAMLPEPLRQPLQQRWHELLEAATQHGVVIDGGEALEAGLVAAFAFSDFVATTCIRHPQLLNDLLTSGDLQRDYGDGTYHQRLQALVAPLTNETELHAVLRQFRRREMARIAWRDLAGLTELETILRELSLFADACVEVTLSTLHQWQQDEMGVPRSEQGEAQSLVVLGMGKLGAFELNFSSDIDLIFTFAEDGNTQGGGRDYSNSQYFIRLGQRLINALNTPTADGQVFRVDMRLRPFGDASQLAISFDAMEDYYQNHGREWERYAMIKARVIAGDAQAGAALMRMLKPFVYRRYLDYSVFDSLREMKALISREVLNRGLENNVKLGAGGIREVEFIGQAFQLIRGGREPRLQRRGILEVLATLRELGQLPEFVVDHLVEAYIFLRRVENRLQALADRQTHALPTDDMERLRIAAAMGYGDWATFHKVLRQHMRVVHEHFEQVFAAPQGETETSVTAKGPDLAAVWQGGLSEGQVLDVLRQAGFEDAAEASRQIAQLRASSVYHTLSPSGQRRMDRLMPLALGAVGGTDNADASLRRCIRLIEAIARRTAYLALLVENPLALSQLAKLLSASPWIAELLTRHPILLDELLDPRTLYAPLSKAELEEELAERIQATAADTEQQLEVLRQFHQANVLRVAAADVAGAMPLMVVSDHLTDIAEVILQQVVRLAADHLLERHGRPHCVVDGQELEPGFGVIAYGKLGGIELGYGSDLDLVFLHDSRGEKQFTNGAKPIDNALFFARLGQRIIHFLTAHTPSGVLYEVDTRLRPSGAAGFLVSSVDSFADYQRAEAWTWEHQALVRARFVAGDEAVARQFDAIRRDTLARQRVGETLRDEVQSMRARMRTELSKSKAGQFDLKQDAGGIADIEFLVQYAVLLWAHQHPTLVRYTDNIRQLEDLTRAGLMPAAESRTLADAYRNYRRRLHQLTLQKLPAIVDSGEFTAERAAVQRIWQRWIEQDEAQ